jgi:Amt family ammonium transporter
VFLPCPALCVILLCHVQPSGIALTLCVGTVFATLVFGLLRHFNLLRVDQMTELAGIDNIDHGGPAYPEFNMTQLNGITSPHGGMQ